MGFTANALDTGCGATPVSSSLLLLWNSGVLTVALITTDTDQFFDTGIYFDSSPIVHAMTTVYTTAIKKYFGL